MKVLQVITEPRIGGAQRILSDLHIKNKNSICYQSRIFSLQSSLGSTLPKNTIYGVGNNSFSFLTIYKLICYIYRFKPDIIHTHLFQASYLISILKYLKLIDRSIVLLHTEHSISNRRRKIFFFKFIDSLIYRNFDSLICISSSVRESFSGWLAVNSNKFITIYNGTSLVRRMRVGTYDSRRFIALGRFIHTKNFEFLISLARLIDDITILIYGEGPLLNKYNDLINEFSLGNRVFIKPYSNDITEIIDLSDFILIPSLSEGFGLVALEAISRGCIPIHSNLPSLREVVSDAGIAVDVFDLDLWVKVLKNLPQLHLDQIRRNCFEQSEKYSLDICYLRYSELYSSMKQCTNMNLPMRLC